MVSSLTSAHLLTKKLSLNNISFSYKYLIYFSNFISFNNAILLIGIAVCFSICFVSYLILLTSKEFKDILPVIALVYFTTPIASFFIFYERLSINYFFGASIILFGVWLTRQ